MTVKEATEELNQVVGKRWYWQPLCSHDLPFHKGCLPEKLELITETLRISTRNPSDDAHYAHQVNATRAFYALAKKNGQPYQELKEVWAARKVSPHIPHGPDPSCKFCYPRVRQFSINPTRFHFPVDTKLKNLYQEFLEACMLGSGCGWPLQQRIAFVERS